MSITEFGVSDYGSFAVCLSMICKLQYDQYPLTCMHCIRTLNMHTWEALTDFPEGVMGGRHHCQACMLSCKEH